MKQYEIKTVTGDIDWNKIDKAMISEYVWGGEYRPVSFAQIVYIRDKGFCVKLTCYESNPKCIYNNNMDPVYKDSCLEFFAAYKPGGYINLEVNANGALLSAYGTGRGERIPLDKLAGDFPSVKAFNCADYWSAEIFISLDIIDKVYKSSDYKAGDIIYGNAYKCGDDCDIPHYGMFNPVMTDKPDYHRPEFFAQFIISE